MRRYSHAKHLEQAEKMRQHNRVAKMEAEYKRLQSTRDKAAIDQADVKYVEGKMDKVSERMVRTLMDGEKKF